MNFKSSKLKHIFLLTCTILILIAGVCVKIPAANAETQKIKSAAEEKSFANATVKLFNSARQFSCNVYVISSDKGTILIDPGYYDVEIKKYIEKQGRLAAVLLTHGHWDHIFALDDLKADFPKADVYIFEKDYGFLTNPDLNCSAANGFQLITKSAARKIQEGALNIGGFEIEVINTPGHTKGSVMYYFKNENILFSGDTILKYMAGPTFRQTGSDEDMKKSIKKFKNFGYSDKTPVYPGHREATTYGYILLNNKDVKNAL